MEKVINSYESLYVINATLADDAIKAVVEKFTALVAENGEVVKVDEWGKRRLAYPINDMPEGYYVLVNFKSGSDFPCELERRYGIDDNVIRYIVTRVEEEKPAQA